MTKLQTEAPQTGGRPAGLGSPWPKRTASKPMAVGVSESGIPRGACPLLPRTVGLSQEGR